MRKPEKPLIQNVRGSLTVLLALTLSLSLSGCSWFTSPINVNMEPIDKPTLVLPDADKVRMRQVEWVLITPENAEEEFKKLQVQGNSIVLFGLTSDGYENISLNLSDIRAFLQQQQSIIRAYKLYYEDANQKIDQANEKIEQAKKESEDDSWLPW